MVTARLIRLALRALADAYFRWTEPVPSHEEHGAENMLLLDRYAPPLTEDEARRMAEEDTP